MLQETLVFKNFNLELDDFHLNPVPHSLLTVVVSEEYQSTYVSPDGEVFHYRVDNTDLLSSLNIDRIGENSLG